MPALPFLIGAGSVLAFGYAMYKMFTNKDAYEAPDSDVNKGLEQSDNVGGFPGVQDSEEKLKKLPEYDQVMTKIKDYETTYNEGVPLTDKQLSGYEKRSDVAKKAVDDYKKQRDSKSYTPVPTPRTAVNTAGQTGMTGLSEISGDSPEYDYTPKPVSTPTSAQLNEKINENLDLMMTHPSSDPAPAPTVNNTNVSNNSKPQQAMGKIPSIRNTEKTFSDMILYSTRVV